MKQFVNDKVLPAMLKFSNMKAIKAICNGMMAVIPLTIVGSICAILFNFPISEVSTYFAEIGLTPYLVKGYNCSIGIIALVEVVAIAYHYANLNDVNPLVAGVVALMCFIIICPDNVVSGDIVVSGVFNMTWAGAQGLVGAIIIGLLSSCIYCIFITKNITIKLPKEVPAGVRSSFAALIPAIVLAALSIVVAIVCGMYNTDLLSMIYNLIQRPLQGVSDNVWAVILSGLVVNLLWWCGIHGGAINSATIGTLLMANQVANADLFAAGVELNAANGAYIFTNGFHQAFFRLTGSGITIGIVVYMLFFAKSKTYKALGKVCLPASIVNINEPVIFGLPIVFNPFMLVPFVLVTLLATLPPYFFTAIGLMPYHNGVAVPTLTPPILSGYLFGGWTWALWQAVIIIISVVVFYPFMKKQDELQLKTEEENAEEDDEEVY